TFSASVSGGHRPYNYTWSFGDGTFGTGSSPTHTYPGAARYLAQVTVHDSRGLTGYGSTLITVTGPPVILSIQQYPSTPYAGDYVSFYANALDPDGGAITS
ncbi:MAG: PKD domain-containing protein, partial [Methanobacteriota archaeon]